MQSIAALQTNGKLQFTAAELPSFQSLASSARRHGFTEQADRVELRQREATDPLLVMIVGEGKFGKSTLINALAGRDIAPVSRIPKTWTVDIYEPTSGAEEAVLYWRSKPSKPEVTSIQDAQAIWKREDAQARSEQTDGWKSDLWQVRWRYQMEWPSANAILVDTPGFSQLRANNQASSVFLYGSEGIEVTTQDAFQYYYPRADIVLWCLNALKLHDQDTLETLRLAAGQGKRVVGVLTYIDKVPQARHNELSEEAKRLFGQYIDEFVGVAAGAKDETIRKGTVNALKRKLDEEVVRRASVLKQEANKTFVISELAELGVQLDSLGEMHVRNLLTFERATDKVAEPFDRAERKVREIWERALRHAVNQLPELWIASGSDPKQFSELVAQQAYDTNAIHAEVLRVQTVLQAETSALTMQRTQELTWERVTLGRSSVIRASAPAAGYIINTGIGELSGHVDSSLAISGAGGDAALYGVGAAIFAMSVLGPIGLAIGAVAGIVGFFQGKERVRNEALAEVKRHLTRYRDTQLNQSVAALKQAREQLEARLRMVIDRSFVKHHGRVSEEARHYLNEVDSTLDGLSLSCDQLNSTKLPPIPGFVADTQSRYLYAYAQKSAPFSKRWDEAVSTAWTPSCKQARVSSEENLRRDLRERQLEWEVRIARHASAELKKRHWRLHEGTGVSLHEITRDAMVHEEVADLIGAHAEQVQNLVAPEPYRYMSGTRRQMRLGQEVKALKENYLNLWRQHRPRTYIGFKLLHWGVVWGGLILALGLAVASAVTDGLDLWGQPIWFGTGWPMVFLLTAASLWAIVFSYRLVRRWFFHRQIRREAAEALSTAIMAITRDV